MHESESAPQLQHLQWPRPLIRTVKLPNNSQELALNMSSEHHDGNEQAPEDDEDETDDVLDPRVKASCAANA